MRVDRSQPGPRVAEHHLAGRGVARIGYPVGIRQLQVVRREMVTASMLRLTVGGPDLEGFHSYQCDDHVALVFPFPDGTRNDPVPDGNDELDWRRPTPPVRKYTVRRLDLDALELDLDFVLHQKGLASDWAAQAQPGEPVSVAGPPGSMAFAHNYDHYVFAVDATGLPAAARWLEASAADTSAEVFIDTDHAHERDYPLAQREHVRVHWLDRSGGSRLADEIAATPLPGGRTFLFAAGEATDIKPLRRWGREHCTDVLVTGYWKRGVAGLDD